MTASAQHVPKELEKKTLGELKSLAKSVGLKNYSKLRKSELTSLLLTERRREVELRLKGSWWASHSTHIYGWSSIAGLAIAAVGVVSWQVDHVPAGAAEAIDDGSIVAPNVSATPKSPPAGLTAAILQQSALANVASQRLQEVGPNRDYLKLGSIVDIDIDQLRKSTLERCDSITYKQLTQLVDLGYIDPNEETRSGRRLIDFLQLIQEYPGIQVTAYIAGPSRKWSYPVSIDGITVPEPVLSVELSKAFIDFSHDANEVHTENGLSAWWEH